MISVKRKLINIQKIQGVTNMKKIMSMILSLTIVLGLITPVQATETLVINNENEETIHLEDIVDSENIELE